MKNARNILKTMFVVILLFIVSTKPIYAVDDNAAHVIMPRYDNLSSATLTMGFDSNNVIYVGLVTNTYSYASGVSGLIKLYDSAGTCLQAWSVSDYEKPIGAQVTYQGTYGETYTATFGGYAYSNNGTPPDRLDLTVTGTCDDN